MRSNAQCIGTRSNAQWSATLLVIDTLSNAQCIGTWSNVQRIGATKCIVEHKIAFDWHAVGCTVHWHAVKCTVECNSACD
eukprot:1138144-Pelagomonas_calceolata.AAC.1